MRSVERDPFDADLVDIDRSTVYLHVISLTLGTLSFILGSSVLVVRASAEFSFVIWTCAIGAIVFGAVGLGRPDPGRLMSRWRSWVGVTLGSVCILLLVVSLVGS